MEWIWSKWFYRKIILVIGNPESSVMVIHRLFIYRRVIKCDIAILMDSWGIVYGSHDSFTRNLAPNKQSIPPHMTPDPERLTTKFNFGQSWGPMGLHEITITKFSDHTSDIFLFPFLSIKLTYLRVCPPECLSLQPNLLVKHPDCRVLPPSQPHQLLTATNRPQLLRTVPAFSSPLRFPGSATWPSRQDFALCSKCQLNKLIRAIGCRHNAVQFQFDT